MFRKVHISCTFPTPGNFDISLTFPGAVWGRISGTIPEPEHMKFQARFL